MKNNRHTAIFIVCLLFMQFTVISANEFPKRKTKPELTKTNFEIGGGLMGSVLYLSRNVKEGNDALGYTFMANYGGLKLLRFSVQYTYYKPINIEPTWYTITANSYEANVEILARFKNNKSFLYPFLGFSYNTFKGYFTGLNDYLNLRETYKPNSNVITNWLGLNLGTGFEHAFGPVVVFFDYRMRIGQMDKVGSINIMDVCYGGGLRIKLYVPTIKSSARWIYNSFNNRYNWF